MNKDVESAIGNQTDPLARVKRTAERKRRMTAHIATDWNDADDWDLDFWQREGPEARLSALVALRNDLVAVRGTDSDLDWDD